MKFLSFLLFLAVLLPCAGLSQQIQTTRKSDVVLPLPKGDDMFHFIIFGDRTGGPPEGLRVLEQAVKDTNLLDPDLVMTVGDLVNGYNENEPWLAEAAEYKGIMKGLTKPWFPVAGNHDIYWRGPNRPPGEHESTYEKHFGPLWYWFQHKNCGFVVLYSDEGDPAKGPKDFTKGPQSLMSEEQLAWLEKSLGEMKSLKQVFVFLHHPRWIEKTYPGTNWNAVHQKLADAGNVKAVFAGHIHRLHYGGKRDGIEYFALAATGGSMPGNYPGAGYVHHMNLVTVRPDTFQMAVVPVGQVLDPRLYTLDRQADIDLARKITPEILSPRILVNPEGLGAGIVEMVLTNPSETAVELNLQPENTSEEWFFAPDHIHLTLSAGETRHLHLTVARVLQGFSKSLTMPTLLMEADYLADGARVTLPPRKVSIPAGLKDLPTDFFAATANQALVLDGKSALRVDLSARELPDGPFTIEAWVNPPADPQTAPFLAKTEQSEYALNLANNVPGFHCFIGEKYHSAIAPADKPIPADQWTHLAGVFDGKEIRLYVNGTLQAQTAAAGARGMNGLPLYIGADPNAKSDPTQFFKGKVDEVRLSKICRYTDTFQPAAKNSPDPNTVRIFHFDKALGPFIPSNTPGGRYATPSGTPNYEAAELKSN